VATSGAEGPASREFRLYGRLEAVEGERMVWVRSGDVTVAVDLSKAPLYIVESTEETLPPWSPERAGTVERHPWNRVRVLSEGTKIFIGGKLALEGGRQVFVDLPGSPLIAVSYDGDDRELLTHLIAGGRDPNEYWNPITRLSLSVGIGAMSLILLSLWTAGTLPTVRTLSFLIAVSPVLALAPPGLALFIMYRRLWRRGLSERTLRDLARLPLRYFSTDDNIILRQVTLPDGGHYLFSRENVPPEGITLIEPLWARVGQEKEAWTVFRAQDSDDPAAQSIAFAGEPEVIAAEAMHQSRMATFWAGLCLIFSLLLNIGLAFFLWRALR